MRSKIAVLALSASLLSPAAAVAQDIEAVTILIDSLTTLPIATGLAADSAFDHFVVIAQGERQLFSGLPLFDFGWDPSGLIRLQRGGQLQADRPYGSLMGMFNTSSNYFYYLGDGGAIPAQIDDYGWELQLQLNMSASDHAVSSGQFAVTVMRVPAAFPASQADIVITSTTSLPVNTGLVTSPGDRFLVRTRGAIRVPAVSTTFIDGWFDPSGLARLERFGQLVPNVPYGSLMGEFSGAGLFNIGDGGTWDAQQVDIGQPLLLHLNMSASDKASLEGRFVVTVNRFPALETGVPAGSAGRELELGKTAPNPTRGATTIAYRARAAGRVRARIYDESGRWVRTLADVQVPAGDHRLDWDGKDDSGRHVPSGVYFCQVSFEDRSETRKVTVLK